jgi:putative ABC transport system substrate-binding protein
MIGRAAFRNGLWCGTSGVVHRSDYGPVRRILHRNQSSALVTSIVLCQRDIKAAVAAAAQSHADAMLVSGDALYNSRRDQVVALAARYAMPSIFHLREIAEAGGLMSYGTDLAAAYRLAGGYVGQILKGAKPGDLPVQQSTNFEFVINMKTAKALGLKPLSNLLSVADEVIQ